MASKEKSMTDLRNILYDEIADLKAKKSTPAKTNAISGACGKIINTLKLQLEYHKLSDKKVGSVVSKLLT